MESVRVATALLALVVVADAAVAWFCLGRDVLESGVVLAAGVVGYLGLFAIGRFGTHCKALSSAMIFTMGVFAVAWTRTPGGARILAVPALAFGLLCFANLCVLGRMKSRGGDPWLVGGIVGLSAMCGAAAGRSGTWRFVCRL